MNSRTSTDWKVANKHRRLMKLIDFMEKLKLNKNKFSMNVVLEKSDCGTVACAMGWASTIPEFRKSGFKVVDSHTVFGEWEYSVAAMQFFDVDDETYRRLFFNYQDPVKTPKQWAKRARKILGL